MKRVGDLIFLFAMLMSPSLAAGSEFVTELTDKTVNSFLKNSEYAVVEFYAPWCGYCQDFAPIYEEAAKKIKEVNDTILVAKLNADEFDEVAESYDIEGLPTIKWFVNGSEKYEYSGHPSIENFMRWIEKVSTSPSKEIVTEEDVEASSKNELSITGVFSEYSGDIHDAFMELALLTDDLFFFKTLNKTLMKVDDTPSMIIRKNIRGHPTEVIRKPFTGVSDPGEEIYNFIDKHRYPDFYIFDHSKVESMMSTLDQVDREYHIHVVVADTLLKDPLLLEHAREAGRAIRDKAILVLSSKDSKSPLNLAFDIKSTDEIQIFAAHTQSIRKYAIPPMRKENLEAHDIIKFTKLVESGDNMHRVYASANLPQEEKENGVLVLVRKNFEEISGDPKKDVVVLSLHPESDESVELEEVFENLAKAFVNISSLLLAKFDASSNEHELIDYPMSELPKVTIFKASKESQPILMDDSEDMDVESVGKFISENAAIEFNLPDLSEYKSDGWEDWNEDDDDDDAEEEDTQEQEGAIHEEL